MLARDAAQLDDDRRDSLRSDHTLFVEYRLVGEDEQTAPVVKHGSPEEAIGAFIGQPASELVNRLSGDQNDSALVQWLMKIDWSLQLVLKAMSRMSPGAVHIPRLMEVNIGGGGVRFTADRRFKHHDRLELKLILPPFMPIHAEAEVLRATPTDNQEHEFVVATRFTSISPDDRERLIRHILQCQAERLRARHLGYE
jgi:hypothetical protein